MGFGVGKEVGLGGGVSFLALRKIFNPISFIYFIRFSMVKSKNVSHTVQKYLIVKSSEKSYPTSEH
jgi:hypothetical protein